MLLPALRFVWPLLFGIALLMLGNGLQGSLVGLRADLEGFGRAATGVIMAGFYGGFLLGSMWTPRAVRVVGHVRVFAALSAVASASILAHAIAVDALAWGLIRVVMGFCFAGIVVVAEHWLNDRAPLAARGQVLSVYMGISFAGVGGGQFLLNVGDPQSADLFIIVSILISLAAVPLLLSAKPSPDMSVPRPVTLRRLYAASPLGTIGTFAAGIANGTVFGMGAYYAGAEGFTVSQTALFMGSLVAGAAVLQWPIGRLSDVAGRRRVITVVTLLAAAAALLADGFAAGAGLPSMLLIALVGGSSLSIHSLSLAYTNDYLERDELVAASGGLVLALGVGSIVGPVAVGALMAVAGPSGFFYVLAANHVALGAFALWLRTRHAPLPEDERSPYKAAPFHGTDYTISAAEEPASGGSEGKESRDR